MIATRIDTRRVTPQSQRERFTLCVTADIADDRILVTAASLMGDALKESLRMDK